MTDRDVTHLKNDRKKQNVPNFRILVGTAVFARTMGHPVNL